MRGLSSAKKSVPAHHDSSPSGAATEYHCIPGLYAILSWHSCAEETQAGGVDVYTVAFTGLNHFCITCYDGYAAFFASAAMEDTICSRSENKKPSSIMNERLRYLGDSSPAIHRSFTVPHTESFHIASGNFHGVTTKLSVEKTSLPSALSQDLTAQRRLRGRKARAAECRKKQGFYEFGSFKPSASVIKRDFIVHDCHTTFL